MRALEWNFWWAASRWPSKPPCPGPLCAVCWCLQLFSHDIHPAVSWSHVQSVRPMGTFPLNLCYRWVTYPSVGTYLYHSVYRYGQYSPRQGLPPSLNLSQGATPSDSVFIEAPPIFKALSRHHEDCSDKSEKSPPPKKLRAEREIGPVTQRKEKSQKELQGWGETSRDFIWSLKDR